MIAATYACTVAAGPLGAGLTGALVTAAGLVVVLAGGGEGGLDVDVPWPRSTAKTAPAIPSSTMQATISTAPVHDRRRGGAGVPDV